MKYQIFALFTIMSTLTAPVAAQDLVIGSQSSGAEFAFTLMDLRELPQHTVVTGNEFVDGEQAFSGVLLGDTIAAAGLSATETIRLTAVNDYQIEIPWSDVEEYNVLLAFSMGGVALSRRDKGPIWVIYPMSAYEELRGPEYNARLIWQLVRIDVE